MADQRTESWHVEVFEEPELLRSFMNHIQLLPNQLVNLQFHALGPTTQRILLTCRMTSTQSDLRIQWQGVERTINPPAVAVATGGGH
jgi:hypothetical protein